MCLLSVCTKRQLESQQTVYRGPDGKQLCTQLCSLCPLLQNPVVTVSKKLHKQHVNKLVQPCLNKDFTDINKHWPLCRPWAITCQQQNIHNLFSRKCLIQLGFHSFRKRTEKTWQVRLHFCFSVSLNPQHPKIFWHVKYLRTSLAQLLLINIQSLFFLCLYSSYFSCTYCSLPFILTVVRARV